MSVLYVSCSTKTYWGRFVKWRASDIEDYKKFPKYEFEASNNPFLFFYNADKKYDTIKLSQAKNKRTPLLEILEKSATTAFLFIKDDTVLYEKYLNGYNRESINTSFSVAKSITSLVIGKAIDEDFIQSVDEPVVNYVPALLQTDVGYSNLLISHLLNMRSGIQFKDHDLPWGDKPKAYYHPRLRQRVKELPLKSEPGSKFEYNSYNPILTGMVLEKATGIPPARYFEKKLWNELGMEYSGSWSMDSEESGMTKMESGLNLRAIDFAKLGRLVLNKGSWNGKQLISEKWMNYSFNITHENKVDEFGDEIYYKNFWWIYGEKTEQNYSVSIISGWGHLGQYLYVFPKEKVIIVRMGKKNIKVDSWGRIFQELVNYMRN